MPDQGSIGTTTTLGVGGTQGQVKGNFCRGLVLGSAVEMVAQAGRDDVSGNPSPPSEYQECPGIFKDIFWPVRSGTRTFKIDVKPARDDGAGTRPRIIIRANPSIGVNSDVVVEAGAGSGSWLTITANASPTGTGVLNVWRDHQSQSGPGPQNRVNWDNIVTS